MVKRAGEFVGGFRVGEQSQRFSMPVPSTTMSSEVWLSGAMQPRPNIQQLVVGRPGVDKVNIKELGVAPLPPFQGAMWKEGLPGGNLGHGEQRSPLRGVGHGEQRSPLRGMGVCSQVEDRGSVRG